MVKKKNLKKLKGDRKDWKGKRNVCTGSGGGIYFLGFIGAIIHYMQTATGFWSVILGILKAIVWPVFLVLKILGL